MQRTRCKEDAMRPLLLHGNGGIGYAGRQSMRAWRPDIERSRSPTCVRCKRSSQGSIRAGVSLWHSSSADSVSLRRTPLN